MTELLSAADFAVYLGRVFHSLEAGRGLTLARIEAPDAPDAPGAGRAPFTLIFQSPKAALVAEGLHRCEIQSGLAVALYIMPIHSPDPVIQTYQAVFN